MAMDVAPADSNLSVPVPDRAVEWKLDHDGRFPRPDESVLVAEVSETTVRFDWTVKAGL